MVRDHRKRGGAARLFDPVPPERWLGGAAQFFDTVPPERWLGGELLSVSPHERWLSSVKAYVIIFFIYSQYLFSSFSCSLSPKEGVALGRETS